MPDILKLPGILDPGRLDFEDRDFIEQLAYRSGDLNQSGRARRPCRFQPGDIGGDLMEELSQSSGLFAGRASSSDTWAVRAIEHPPPVRACLSTTQTGRPRAPARWATDVSEVMTRSRTDMTAAVSIKASGPASNSSPSVSTFIPEGRFSS